MLMMLVERKFTAQEINAVINDPSVYDWVRGPLEGKLDLAPTLSDHRNVLLMGEFGGVLFQQHQPGLYEAHTQVLPPGRGQWAMKMAREALQWMFTKTEAVEVIALVPQGNVGALAMGKRLGFTLEMTKPNGWTFRGRTIPTDVYSLKLQDWMRTAPGMKERGDWFHARLEAEYARLGIVHAAHPDDDSHDQHVGATAEIIFGGQPQKAIAFYNRWACMAGYAPAAIVALDPLTINIQESILVVCNNDFEVMQCQ